MQMDEMHAKNVPPTAARMVPDPSPERKVVASDMDGKSHMYNDALKTYKTSRPTKFPANITKDLCPRVAQGVECIKNKNGRCEFGHKKITDWIMPTYIDWCRNIPTYFGVTIGKKLQKVTKSG